MFFSPAFPEGRTFVQVALAVPAAAFEVLGYLVVVAVASLCFLAGWLPINGAVVVTVILLAVLLLLSWIHLGQGRHPCFLLLCTLMFFQEGRLLAYCLGGESQPMQVQLMQLEPFGIARSNEGIVLLCLALSAICIYAPCRWNYKPFPPPSSAPVVRYLPYLYLLFFATLPIQLFRNYRYFQWVQENGGYLSIFQYHGDLASSVPFLVRAVPIISLPVFVAIFVFEYRRKAAYFTAALYLGAASLTLLTGSRTAFFRLILALWYVVRVKSARGTRLLALVVFAVALMIVADAVGSLRDNPDEVSGYSFLPLRLLELEGYSLDVTSTVVRYHEYFEPYIWPYLFHDLQDALPFNDQTYRRGKALALDASVLLNASAFSYGRGTAGSYLAEAYLFGGVTGVALLSLLIGGGLHGLYYLSRNAVTLFLVVMILPEVLYMPRGTLLEWASALIRNAISIVLLLAGWKIYTFFTSIRHSPGTPQVAMHGESVQ